MPAKRLDSLLNPNEDGGLGAIIRRARGMEELVAKLRAALPADEASSIVAANLRDDGTLVVLVSSPAWASRLRFEGDKLMRAAEPSGSVVRCQVRVARGAADG